MGDSEGTRQLLLEHVVRIEDDGVVVYKVYSEVSYSSKEEFFAARPSARQGRLFPEVGTAGNQGSRNEVRQPRGTLNPHDEIQDAPTLSEAEATEYYEETEDSWLDFEDEVDTPGSQPSRDSYKTSRQLSDPPDSSSTTTEATPLESSRSPTTSPNNQPSQTPRRSRWQTSKAQHTSSKGSWGRST